MARSAWFVSVSLVATLAARAVATSRLSGDRQASRNGRRRSCRAAGPAQTSPTSRPGRRPPSSTRSATTTTTATHTLAQPAARHGKSGYLSNLAVDPVVIRGKQAKGSQPGYALTLGGGGLDEAALIALAEAVTLP